MSQVWLFKSDSDSNISYEETLSQNDFNTENIPTLEFDEINKSHIKNVLEQPHNFSGIIFTSARAVQSIKDIYQSLQVSIHQEWSTKLVFVVGKATSEAVKNHLSLNSIGSETGNATQLATVILERTKPFEKPLFFPCGNLKRNELPNLLAKNDRDFRAVTTYETKVHPQLESALRKLSSQGKPDFVVFFSPSGVQYAIPVLNKFGISLVNLKVIAIGPTTNAALVNNSIPVSGICAEPSPTGLVQVLNTLRIQPGL